MPGTTRERHAELVLKGMGDIPADVLLAVADDIRQAVARLDVAGLSIRVSPADDEAPTAPSGA